MKIKKVLTQEEAEEFKKWQEAWEKEYYHKEDMWQEDLPDAIASGNLPELEDALAKGWDINQPLLRFYAETYRGTCNWIEERRAVIFPVMWAIQQNCFASVEWLILHGAKLDMEDTSREIWTCDFSCSRGGIAERCHTGNAAPCCF